MADDNNLEIGVNINANKAEAGSRRAKTAISSVDKLSRDLQRSYRALKSSIDPAFAAQERYNRSIDNYKKLLASGVVTQKEYRAGLRAAKKDLEDQVSSINANSAVARAAAERQKRIDQETASRTRQLSQQAAAAEREKAAAKIKAAQDARRVQKAAEEAELRAIRLAASTARQSAAEASRYASRAAAPARGVAPGSMTTDRSLAQLENSYRRVYAASQRAAERAATAAQAAADASNRRQAASAEARAAREKAAAEGYMARAIEIRRTIASVEGAARAEEMAAERANRDEQKRLAKEAAAAAAESSRVRRRAARDAAEAEREATRETKRLAQAEREAAATAQQLRASIDPTFAAQERYNETMRVATQLLMANKLRQGEFTQIMRQAKTQMDVNVRSMGRMNSVYVQMGYQAQDVTASVASGINPLVILAQQGGQTAAALSMMGGRIGQVAAFMAGPWGAAILGATMALGFLWQSLKDGEKATKDVMNAEDRRKMTLKELTAALKEYTAQQAEANKTTMQGAIDKSFQTMRASQEIMDQMTKAQTRLTNARKIYNDAINSAMAGTPEGAGVVAGALIELKLAERGVAKLKAAYTDAMAAHTEATAAYAQTVSAMSDLEKNEQAERQASYGAYKQDMLAAGTSQIKQQQALGRYMTSLTSIQERYNKLKEQENAASKDALRNEKEIFQTRQAAIGLAGKELQKSGYKVGENFQFGKVGSHPGMGRQAHGQFAIDVNMPGIQNESADPVARDRMDKMVKTYQARGFRVLWNGKVYEPGSNGASYDIRPGANQHKDHAHIEAPKSIVGKPSGTKLGNELVSEAEQQAREAKAAADAAREEEHQSAIADLEFKKELAGEELASVLELQDQKIAAQKAFYGNDSKQAIDAMRERIRIERAQTREAVQNKTEEINQKLSRDLQYEAQAQSIRESNIDGQTKINEFLLQNGRITEEESIRRKAVSLQTQYEEQMRHEERMYQLTLQSLRDRAALEGILPAEKRRINAEIEQAELQHQQNVFNLNRTYADGVRDISLAAAQTQQDKWNELGRTLESSLGSVLQGLWSRQMTLQQAFIAMGDAVANHLMQAGAKMLSNWIMQQLQMLIVKRATDTAMTASTVAQQGIQTAAVIGATTAQTGAKVASGATESGIIAATTGAKLTSEAIKTGAAVSGAATSTGATAAAGMAEIGTNAAVAAAGAYKSTVVIPFIGPIAAPAAAALALGAVLGFGALVSARGGQERVPYDGQMTELHKNEMVLPAHIANPLRDSLRAPNSQPMLGSVANAGVAAMSMMTSNSTGGDLTFNYQPKTTHQTASLDEMLRRDGQTMRKWFRNEVRNGALKGMVR